MDDTFYEQFVTVYADTDEVNRIIRQEEYKLHHIQFDNGVLVFILVKRFKREKHGD